MKGLKKIALATAVAAAPFAAQAELTAMNDSAMGNVTGQAGVTIELDDARRRVSWDWEEGLAEAVVVAE